MHQQKPNLCNFAKSIFKAMVKKTGSITGCGYQVRRRQRRWYATDRQPVYQ